MCAVLNVHRTQVKKQIAINEQWNETDTLGRIRI